MTAFRTAQDALAGLPDGMRALAEGVVAKAEDIASRHPDWPLVALPRALAEAFGVAGPPREFILSGAILLYAAADVIDDAQDGDLSAEVWGDPPWPRAVNVGNALVFAALGCFVTAAPRDEQGAMAWAVARAGCIMAGGQHRDFDLGPGGLSSTESDYLACIEGKSGGSLGLFCQAMAIAGGLPVEGQERARILGQSVGAAVQIRSDMGEIWSNSASRDLANGRRTLPVLYGLAASDASGRERLNELASDPTRKALLVATLDALGTGPYCDMRIAAYAGQALAALERMGLDPEHHAAIADLIEWHGQPQWRAAI